MSLIRANLQVLSKSKRKKRSPQESGVSKRCWNKYMKVVIASKSPVKEGAVKRGFKTLFPDESFDFECVLANSGIGDQPMSDDETRSGALARVKHARELSSGADFYAGLEGGVEEKFGDLYNFGWVVIESKDLKKGYGRTFAFALPPAIRDAMIHEGLEQS